MNETKNYKLYVHIFPDNKTYVGITKQDVEKRWQNGYGYKNQPVYKDILKYGWENIRHIVIYNDLTKNEAKEKEIELIKILNSKEHGFNVSNGGGLGGYPWVEFKYNGSIYTAEELANISKFNISGHDITNRVNEHGWSIEKALNTPKGRRNVVFQYRDSEYTVKELYEIRKNKELTYNQIKNRLLKYNWDAERAITQPSNQKKQPFGVGTCEFEYNGKKYNSYELCQLSNLPDLKPVDITTRINRHGWSVERAITQPKRKR